MQDVTKSMEGKILELQQVILKIDNKGLYTAIIGSLLMNAQKTVASKLEISIVVFLILSIASALISMWPRTNFQEGDLSWPSLVNFDITGIEKQFKEYHGNETSLAKQIKNLVQICYVKTLLIKCSFLLLFIAFCFYVKNLLS